MKKIILLLCITYSLFSCAQENKEMSKEFRIQGYLFVQTSMKKDTSASAGEMKLAIDKPKLCFFIPLKDMKSDFKESINSFKKPTKEELYLPVSLTETERSIKSINSNLNFYIKDNSINILPIKENDVFSRKLNTIVKIGNKTYYIVYLDGVWNKQKTPFKWTEVLSMGNYNTSSLDKKYKEGYSYYFLKELKVISYELRIKESEQEEM